MRLRPISRSLINKIIAPNKKWKNVFYSAKITREIWPNIPEIKKKKLDCIVKVS